MSIAEKMKREIQSRSDVLPCCKEKGSLKKVQTGVEGVTLLICTFCGHRFRAIKRLEGMDAPKYPERSGHTLFE